MSAFYKDTVANFLQCETSALVGVLNLEARHSVSQVRLATTISWERTIGTLKSALGVAANTNPIVRRWGLLLEFEIPRRDRRIDAVLLAGETIVVLEFKTGDHVSETEACRQAEHYALELRDFHRESRDRKVLPLVVASGATGRAFREEAPAYGTVAPVRIVADEDLASILITLAHTTTAAVQIDVSVWDSAAYEPIPSIIEAARMLFAGQSVREISHSHTDSQNLTATTDFLVATVARAQREGFKAVCFVTGVPGAGKTLAGLNAVHSPDLVKDGRPAGSFLSGNGPLVKVVSEALARDHKQRSGGSLQESRRRIKTFVQSVHGFLKEYRSADRIPPDHVIVFDEAQRAWSGAKMLKELLQRATTAEREALTDVSSEPSMMLRILDRFPDWTVLIALVGGGQEIHDGEAGLAEWGRALSVEFPHWRVFASQEATEGGGGAAGSRLFAGVSPSPNLAMEPSLHLPVSQRSFRAEAVAWWVNAILEGRAEDAAALALQCAEFPIRLTRSLDAARDWLRTVSRGEQRSGLLASSGALRLRAHGLEVSSGFRGGLAEEDWFLAPPEDVRSSHALEIALTEFECLGLELDWVGLCWGDDFTRNAEAWEFRRWAGSVWQQVQKRENQEFLRNKYRVLLTRARQGLVIWVPPGSDSDPTRPKASLERTASYLLNCGARPL
jgi:Uncharacterized conserved protein (DUF2075)